MPLFSSGSLPPACAQCLNTLQLAAPGSLPQESPWALFRSAEGMLRLDYGSTSVITNPREGIRMLLDHVAQTYRITPLNAPAIPGAPGIPGMPGMPQMRLPGMPGLPGMAMPAIAGQNNVQDLGRRIIDGLEARGTRYLSGPQTMERWMSTKLQLPVLTTMTGPFGQQICKCQAIPMQPDPSKFQIPPGYTQLPAR